jgi:hypothetical protein
MIDPQHNHGTIEAIGSLTTVNALSVSYMNEDGKMIRTPHGEVMLNGGTMRGPLRKAAVKVVRRLVAEQKKVPEKGLLSLSDEYMLGSGYDRTRETNNEKDGGADPAGEARLREINPLLSLFGRWGLPGYLETWEMRTSIDNLMTAGQGARADQFERDPAAVDFLTASDQDILEREIAANRDIQKQIDAKKKALAQLGKPYRAATTDKEKKAIGKDMDAIKKDIAEMQDSREGGEQSIKHPLGGHESISGGTLLSSGFALIQGRDIYLGLLLHSLNEFARYPHLGGHAAIGFGRVTGEYTVQAWPPGTMSPTTIGAVRFDSNGFVIEGDTLKAAYDNFPKALEACRLDIHTLKALRELEASEAP